MSAITLSAPAKLNLYLHILGRRPDGYHLLESLVVFTSLVDQLMVEEAADLSLRVEGEFATQVGSLEKNLVLRAARALQAHTATTRGAAITLHKQIPVGAGLGGGSADAAATLRALNQLWQLGLNDAALQRIALPLGADVPMCLAARPSIARGIGEQLEPVTHLAPLHALLVYPHAALLSAEVYAHYRHQTARPTPALPDTPDAAAWLAALAPTRNDLQSPAITLRPEVAEVLLALETVHPSSDYVRMTGSGACCFALYANAAEASRAATSLAAQYPDWWVRAVDVI